MAAVAELPLTKATSPCAATLSGCAWKHGQHSSSQTTENKAPATCGLNESSFQGTLTRTKTTGKDKKIQSGVLHVSRNCWLVDPEWVGE